MAAGLLAHARAASIFTTPAIDGYKRYDPYLHMASRIISGISGIDAKPTPPPADTPYETPRKSRTGSTANISRFFDLR